MNSLPAGQGEEDGGDATEKQKDNRGNRVELDELLSGETDVETGCSAGA
jgi:hypothetical protein